MILAHLVQEERPVKKSLNNCVAVHCKDVEPKKMTAELEFLIQIAGWGKVPAVDMWDYAQHDAWMTLQLFEALLPKVKAENLLNVWIHKMRFIRDVLIPMEDAGILLDQELCETQAAVGHSEMDRLTRELGGRNPASPKDLEIMLIKELGLPYLYKKRANGTHTPTFDKAAMEQYEAVLSRTDNKLAQDILAYRGWQKATSSNYEAYLKLVSPDGRLRPNYKLHGTKTGRLSCEMPNLQQIPRAGKRPWNGKMKDCFIAREGYQLWTFDYAQLELRLGTSYANIQRLKDVFNAPPEDNRDIFSEMAIELGQPRPDTKTQVYSIQYGAGWPRIAFVFGLSEAEAKARIADYYAKYPEFKIVKEKAARYARQHGKINTWTNRFRHFGNPQEHAYKAFNSVIQGGAADIVEYTMLRLNDEGYNTPDCRMLLQVHDEVVLEIRNNLVNSMVPLITQCMENVGPKDFGVRFAVEAKRWGAK